MLPIAVLVALLLGTNVISQSHNGESGLPARMRCILRGLPAGGYSPEWRALSWRGQRPQSPSGFGERKDVERRGRPPSWRAKPPALMAAEKPIFEQKAA